MKKIVVIISGGLDSTVLTYDLKNQGYEILGLSFHYGQKHSKELTMAMATCARLGIKHRVIQIDPILLKGSSLTSEKEVPEGHYWEETMKATIVPNRNMLMLASALSYAISNEAEGVAYGAHAGDHAIYPDCRPEFIEKMREIAKIIDYKPLELLTPYQNITKADIVKKGLELGVDFNLTWTCYNGWGKPCGRCGSCVERSGAFIQNRERDPLYTKEDWKEAFDYAEEQEEKYKLK